MTSTGSKHTSERQPYHLSPLHWDVAFFPKARTRGPRPLRPKAEEFSQSRTQAQYHPRQRTRRPCFSKPQHVLSTEAVDILPGRPAPKLRARALEPDGLEEHAVDGTSLVAVRGRMCSFGLPYSMAPSIYIYNTYFGP